MTVEIVSVPIEKRQKGVPSRISLSVRYLACAYACSQTPYSKKSRCDKAAHEPNHIPVRKIRRVNEFNRYSARRALGRYCREDMRTRQPEDLIPDFLLPSYRCTGFMAPLPQSPGSLMRIGERPNYYLLLSGFLGFFRRRTGEFDLNGNQISNMNILQVFTN